MVINLNWDRPAFDPSGIRQLGVDLRQGFERRYALRNEEEAQRILEQAASEAYPGLANQNFAGLMAQASGQGLGSIGGIERRPLPSLEGAPTRTSTMSEVADRRVGSAFEDVGEPVQAAAAVTPNVTGRGMRAETLADVPEPYRGMVQAAAVARGIDPDVFARQLFQESGFDPNVISGTRRSTAGAMGVAQFMPATAAEMGIDPLNPAQAIPASAQYTDRYKRQYGNLGLGLMAYNWGPGNVEDWLKAGANPNRVPRETRDYVQRITGQDVGYWAQAGRQESGDAPSPAGPQIAGGVGGVPQSAQSSPVAFSGPSAGIPGATGLPSRETLIAMARNPVTREYAMQLIAAARKGDMSGLKEVSPGAALVDPITGREVYRSPHRPSAGPVPVRYIDMGTYWSIRDNVTGEEIERAPKDIAGVTAEREKGKAQAGAELGLPAQLDAAEAAMRQIEAVTKHPGIDWGTGLWALGSNIPGHPGYDFRAAVEPLRGQAFAFGIDQMVGMGALSDAEGRAITASVANLDTIQNKQQFLDQVEAIRVMVQRGVERARQKAASGSGGQGVQSGAGIIREWTPEGGLR